MPSVFILAKDWMLRAGVRAELRERGVEALGFETLAQAGVAIATGTIPAASVIDSEAVDADNPALLALVRSVPTVWLSALGPGGVAPRDAAAAIQRPFSIGDVVQRVCELLQGQAV